jgi:hypothetical protein
VPEQRLLKSGVKLISGVWTLKKKGHILPIGLAGSQSTLEGYTIKKYTASCSSGPEATVKDTTVTDTLTELLRKGAGDLIAKALDPELEALLAECYSSRLEDGRAEVVRNGYLPGQTV